MFVYGRFELLDADDSSVVCYCRVHQESGAATVVPNVTDCEYEWAAPRVVVEAWKVG